MSAKSQPEVVILCVEAELLEIISYCLSALSVTMVAAADGYDANALLRKWPVRLLIVDRLLPPWPGLDTLRQLRESRPDMRVAFIDDESCNAAALARVCGAHTVLSRPLTCNKIAAALGCASSVS